MHLTVCFYHVTYEFESESTLCSCLNVKELLVRRRRNIWILSDCNGTRTHNNLVRKRTLNHLAKLAKWLSFAVSTYLYGRFDCMFLSCQVRVWEWIHTLQLPECQGTPCSKQAPYLKINWMQRDSNPSPLSWKTNTQPFGQTGQMIELCCEYLPVRCIWLYVFIRVNPHSTVAWMPRNSLLERDAISEDEVTAKGLEPRTTYFLNEHSTIWPNWPNDWAVLWVLFCTVYLTVCFYHVTYDFQSESTLYSCLNVKELLARSRRHIWRLSHCKGTRNYNHLVRKRTLNHLAKPAKWLSYAVSTFLYGAFDCMFLSCHVRVSEWIQTLQLHECQGIPCSKQAPYLKIKWLQWDSNPQPLTS